MWGGGGGGGGRVWKFRSERVFKIPVRKGLNA